MFGVNVTDYDRKVWEEELCDFLPDKIVDAHVHIYKEEMQRVCIDDRKGCVNWPHMVAPDLTIEDMKESFSQMFPGKDVKAVIMGMPTCHLDAVNEYALSCAKQENIPALYCTNWDTTKEEIRAAMAAGFAGIKPYLNNCPSYIPEKEVRIFDYLTHEHMEVMNELGGIVMLHIPRSLRLRDPVNLAQMLEIDEKYPNLRYTVPYRNAVFAIVTLDEVGATVRGRSSTLVGSTPEQQGVYERGTAFCRRLWSPITAAQKGRHLPFDPPMP